MVFAAGHQEERRLDAIGKHDGGVLHILLRLLPHGGANAVLAFFGGVNVAHAEPWAVGVERNEVDLAAHVDGRFEAVGLRDEQVGGVATVARALHAHARAVGDAHANHFVGGGGDALHPGFARVADFKTHRRLDHGVAVRGEDVGKGVPRVVKEIFVHEHDGRILLAFLVIGGVVQHAVARFSVGVEVVNEFCFGDGLCGELWIALEHAPHVAKGGVGDVDVGDVIAVANIQDGGGAVFGKTKIGVELVAVHKRLLLLARAVIAHE